MSYTELLDKHWGDAQTVFAVLAVLAFFWIVTRK